MSNICANCKNAIRLNIVVDSVNLIACKEAFYYKTKYDNSKKMKLTSFIPVVKEDDGCSKFKSAV